LVAGRDDTTRSCPKQTQLLYIKLWTTALQCINIWPYWPAGYKRTNSFSRALLSGQKSFIPAPSTALHLPLEHEIIGWNPARV
jgi:hypothetical protein